MLVSMGDVNLPDQLTMGVGKVRERQLKVAGENPSLMKCQLGYESLVCHYFSALFRYGVKVLILLGIQSFFEDSCYDLFIISCLS